MKMIAEFKVPTTGAKEKQDFNKCSRSFSDYAVVNFDDGIQLYKEFIYFIQYEFGTIYRNDRLHDR